MKGKVGVSPSQQVHTGGFLCVCVGEGARGGGGGGVGGGEGLSWGNMYRYVRI